MTLAVLILACIFFIEAFLFLEMGRQARGIVADARDALRVMADEERSDVEKERCARAASALILKATLLLVLELAAIGAVLAALLSAVVLIVPDGRAELGAALASPVVFVSLTLVAAGYVWVRNGLLRQI